MITLKKEPLAVCCSMEKAVYNSNNFCLKWKVKMFCIFIELSFVACSPMQSWKAKLVEMLLKMKQIICSAFQTGYSLNWIQIQK